MEYSVIVAGTGFEGRAARIRAYVRPGDRLILKREPHNEYDPNAIAVYGAVRRWYTLFRRVEFQIGYIKANKAKLFSRRISDGGKIISATVKSIFTAQNHPRVSVVVVTNW